MGGIQTGLTDAQLLASQLKAHELAGMASSASEIDNIVAKTQIVLPKNLLNKGKPFNNSSTHKSFMTIE